MDHKSSDNSNLNEDIKNIQQIYDDYGYGFLVIKFIIVLFFSILIYGIHLSIFAIMQMPITKY